jgi:hypothetical protein
MRYRVLERLLDDSQQGIAKRKKHRQAYADNE